ncbi:hypothetical protein Leryth_012162 [Lithospermum erythrorhizon]|nr:hypothetical protein Leryth_012162 [Lithospermum erythrorhizon]
MYGVREERDELHGDVDDDFCYVETDPTGRFGRLAEVLGKGAMKTVYKAIDEDLGMEVAWSQVKLRDLLKSPEDLQRLYSEVHLLRTLNHDSIIRFYTSWIDVQSRTFNFITEMFTSGTLREYRNKYKKVNIRAIKIWARQILEGLVYLHEHDPPVIHRDLKCDNIFVNGHLGQVKIGDLGLATILQGSHRAHSVIGTPEFMAPELYEENYNELVDVYSFGMCMLEMLTLEYPYSECNNPAQIYKKVISGKKPRAFYKVQDLESQRFIGKCLETASKRLSAKELIHDPFLVLLDIDDELHGNQKPFLNESIEIEDLRLCDLPRTNMTITGKLNPEDGTIFLRVQIADKEGTVRNVFFPFDIVNDTPIDVANEMVKDLEISDWNPSEIANMIDAEITGLVPHWRRLDDPHPARSLVLNYQIDEDEHHHPSYSFSSSSSSQVSLSGLVHSQSLKESTHNYNWLEDELFDDTSSQSSSYSVKYSNVNYCSLDDPETSLNLPDISNAQSSSRFCPQKYSTTGEALARSAAKQCEDMLRSQKASTSKGDSSRSLTRNRSFVDMRSQLLHRALVEEVSKRRQFKTAGALEDIGFQSPFGASGGGSRRGDARKKGGHATPRR